MAGPRAVLRSLSKRERKMIDATFEWEVTGVIHVEWDRRFVQDEFGTAVMVPFCGQPWEFQEH